MIDPSIARFFEPRPGRRPELAGQVASEIRFGRKCRVYYDERGHVCRIDVPAERPPRRRHA